MTSYEKEGPFADGSFRVHRVEDDRREMVCKVDSGSLQKNAEDAELIVGALNKYAVEQ